VEEVAKGDSSRDLASYLFWAWRDRARDGSLNGIVPGFSNKGELAKLITDLRKKQCLSADMIRTMMDVFVGMVATKQIKLNGKPNWRVFLAKQEMLIEHAKRRTMFGKAEALTADESAERLKNFLAALDKMRTSE
jgi:hypothetical protein